MMGIVDMNAAINMNYYVAPDIGKLIEQFYKILKNGNTDPLTIPARIYLPMKAKLWQLRRLSGTTIARSIGHPQTTYQIMIRFQKLLDEFEEEKRFLGSVFYCPRDQVLNEMASIKEYANNCFSELVDKFN
jgi:hypothetical protein